MSNPRRRPYVVLMLAFFGSAAVFNFISSPGFETVRSVDLVRLMAAGVCFGAAIVLLVMGLRGKKAP